MQEPRKQNYENLRLAGKKILKPEEQKYFKEDIKKIDNNIANNTRQTYKVERAPASIILLEYYDSDQTRGFYAPYAPCYSLYYCITKE